jgi:phage terminase large subunit-like protein
VVGICRTKDDYSINVLDQRFRDDSWFCFICRLDKDDDPFDWHNWRKPNPNLGVSVLEDGMRLAAKKAKRSPSDRANFLIKRMNLWVGAKDAWLSPDAWKACAGTIDMEELKGRACCGGLDLAKTRDMTAFVLAFPWDDGSMVLVPHFFIPEGEDLDAYERKAGLPKGTYREWEQLGYLTITSGFSCDYAHVEDVICGAAKTYDLYEVAFDEYNATDIADRLHEKGLLMVAFSQHITNMNAPCKEFERLMLERLIVHGDNPIMNWHAGNVTVRAYNDLIRPIKSGGPDGKMKGATRNKIDGIVSGVMAVARAQQIGMDVSVYEKRGLLTV